MLPNRTHIVIIQFPVPWLLGIYERFPVRWLLDIYEQFPVRWFVGICKQFPVRWLLVIVDLKFPYVLVL